MTEPTHHGTVNPRDPRRHLYLERRARQLVVAALRDDRAAQNEAWRGIFAEFGRTAFAIDAIEAIPAIIRRDLGEAAAEQLAARIAKPLFGLAQSLENYRAHGGSHDTPSPGSDNPGGAE